MVPCVVPSTPPFAALEGLDEMRGLFAAGKLSGHVDRVFALADIGAAFNYSKGSGEGGVGEHIGKIAIAMG